MRNLINKYKYSIQLLKNLYFYIILKQSINKLYEASA